MGLEKLGKVNADARGYNEKLKRAKIEQQNHMKEIKNNHTKVLNSEEHVKKLSIIIKTEKSTQAISHKEKMLERGEVQVHQIKREVSNLEEKKTSEDDHSK